MFIKFEKSEDGEENKVGNKRPRTGSEDYENMEKMNKEKKIKKFKY